MKVAEALVLRKHLEAKVKQLEPLKIGGDNGIFEVKTEQRMINDTVQEVKSQVPRITLAEVTEEYNKYSKALRQIDIKIQEQNWISEIDFDDSNLAI